MDRVARLLNRVIVAENTVGGNYGIDLRKSPPHYRKGHPTFGRGTATKLVHRIIRILAGRPKDKPQTAVVSLPFQAHRATGKPHKMRDTTPL